ncbi:MAG: hypothetical protein ACOY3K_08165 [Candidatus Omnitrophota bacterium]
MVFVFTLTDCFSSYAASGLDLAPRGEIPSALRLEIPRELASIEEVFESPAKRDPKFVLHIQNAHANYEAQVKIKEILQYLHERYKFDTLFVEGAASELKADQLRIFPDPESNLKLADHLAQKGELTGAELFMMEYDKQARAFGIERPELYRKDYDALRSVFKAEPQIARYLFGFEKELDRASSKIFDLATRRLIGEWRKFEAGRREFLPYVKELARAADDVLRLDLKSLFAQVEWPQLTRLLVLQDMEAELDRDKAKTEKAAVLEALKRSGFSAKVIGAVEAIGEETPKAAKARTGEALPRFVLEDLAAEGKDKGFRFSDYPHFALWAGVTALEREIVARELFREIEVLFGKILDELASSEQQREALALFRDLELLRKLYRLELTRDQWQEALGRKEELAPDAIFERVRQMGGGAAREEIRNQKSEILNRSEIRNGRSATPAENTASRPAAPDPRNAYQATLLNAFERAFVFYEVAAERESVFYEKLQSALAGPALKKAVIITGGFHTDGFRDYMRGHGISYGILMPRLTKAQADSKYREVMLGETPTIFDLAHMEIANLLGMDPRQITRAEIEARVRSLVDSLLQVATPQNVRPALEDVNKIVASSGMRFALNDDGELEFYYPGENGEEVVRVPARQFIGAKSSSASGRQGPEALSPLPGADVSAPGSAPSRLGTGGQARRAENRGAKPWGELGKKIRAPWEAKLSFEYAVYAAVSFISVLAGPMLALALASATTPAGFFGLFMLQSLSWNWTVLGFIIAWDLLEAPLPQTFFDQFLSGKGKIYGLAAVLKFLLLIEASLVFGQPVLVNVVAFLAIDYLKFKIGWDPTGQWHAEHAVWKRSLLAAPLVSLMVKLSELSAGKPAKVRPAFVSRMPAREEFSIPQDAYNFAGAETPLGEAIIRLQNDGSIKERQRQEDEKWEKYQQIPGAIYIRSLRQYKNDLEKIGRQAELKGRSVFYPFGGYDAHKPFLLVEDAEEVVVQSAWPFGGPRDLLTFLRSEGLYREGFQYSRCDTASDIAHISDGMHVEGLGGLALVRIINYLGGSIRGLHYFRLGENGRPEFLDPSNADQAGQKDYHNVVVEFEFTNKAGKLRRVKYINLYNSLDEPSPGYEAFLARWRFQTLLLLAVPRQLWMKYWPAMIRRVLRPAQLNHARLFADNGESGMLLSDGMRFPTVEKLYRGLKLQSMQLEEGVDVGYSDGGEVVYFGDIPAGIDFDAMDVSPDLTGAESLPVPSTPAIEWAGARAETREEPSTAERGDAQESEGRKVADMEAIIRGIVNANDLAPYFRGADIRVLARRYVAGDLMPREAEILKRLKDFSANRAVSPMELLWKIMKRQAWKDVLIGSLAFGILLAFSTAAGPLDSNALGLFKIILTMMSAVGLVAISDSFRTFLHEMGHVAVVRYLGQPGFIASVYGDGVMIEDYDTDLSDLQSFWVSIAGSIPTGVPALITLLSGFVFYGVQSFPFILGVVWLLDELAGVLGRGGDIEKAIEDLQSFFEGRTHGVPIKGRAIEKFLAGCAPGDGLRIRYRDREEGRQPLANQHWKVVEGKLDSWEILDRIPVLHLRITLGGVTFAYRDGYLSREQIMSIEKIALEEADSSPRSETPPARAEVSKDYEIGENFARIGRLWFVHAAGERLPAGGRQLTAEALKARGWRDGERIIPLRGLELNAPIPENPESRLFDLSYEPATIKIILWLQELKEKLGDEFKQLVFLDVGTGHSGILAAAAAALGARKVYAVEDGSEHRRRLEKIQNAAELWPHMMMAPEETAESLRNVEQSLGLESGVIELIQKDATTSEGLLEGVTVDVAMINMNMFGLGLTDPTGERGLSLPEMVVEKHQGRIRHLVLGGGAGIYPMMEEGGTKYESLKQILGPGASITVGEFMPSQGLVMNGAVVVYEFNREGPSSDRTSPFRAETREEPSTATSMKVETKWGTIEVQLKGGEEPALVNALRETVRRLAGELAVNERTIPRRLDYLGRGQINAVFYNPDSDHPETPVLRRVFPDEERNAIVQERPNPARDGFGDIEEENFVARSRSITPLLVEQEKIETTFPQALDEALSGGNEALAIQLLEGLARHAEAFRDLGWFVVDGNKPDGYSLVRRNIGGREKVFVVLHDLDGLVRQSSHEKKAERKTLQGIDLGDYQARSEPQSLADFSITNLSPEALFLFLEFASKNYDSYRLSSRAKGAIQAMFVRSIGSMEESQRRDFLLEYRDLLPADLPIFGQVFGDGFHEVEAIQKMPAQEGHLYFTLRWEYFQALSEGKDQFYRLNKVAPAVLAAMRNLSANDRFTGAAREKKVLDEMIDGAVGQLKSYLDNEQWNPPAENLRQRLLQFQSIRVEQPSVFSRFRNGLLALGDRLTKIRRSESRTQDLRKWIRESNAGIKKWRAPSALRASRSARVKKMIAFGIATATIIGTVVLFLTMNPSIAWWTCGIGILTSILSVTLKIRASPRLRIQPGDGAFARFFKNTANTLLSAFMLISFAAIMEASAALYFNGGWQSLRDQIAALFNRPALVEIAVPPSAVPEAPKTVAENVPAPVLAPVPATATNVTQPSVGMAEAPSGDASAVVSVAGVTTTNFAEAGSSPLPDTLPLTGLFPSTPGLQTTTSLPPEFSAPHDLQADLAKLQQVIAFGKNRDWVIQRAKEAEARNKAMTLEERVERFSEIARAVLWEVYGPFLPEQELHAWFYHLMYAYFLESDYGIIEIQHISVKTKNGKRALVPITGKALGVMQVEDRTAGGLIEESYKYLSLQPEGRFALMRTNEAAGLARLLGIHPMTFAAIAEQPIGGDPESARHIFAFRAGDPEIAFRLGASWLSRRAIGLKGKAIKTKDPAAPRNLSDLVSREGFKKVYETEYRAAEGKQKPRSDEDHAKAYKTLHEFFGPRAEARLFSSENYENSQRSVLSERFLGKEMTPESLFEAVSEIARTQTRYEGMVEAILYRQRGGERLPVVMIGDVVKDGKALTKEQIEAEFGVKAVTDEKGQPVRLFVWPHQGRNSYLAIPSTVVYDERSGIQTVYFGTPQQMPESVLAGIPEDRVAEGKAVEFKGLGTVGFHQYYEERTFATLAEVEAYLSEAKNLGSYGFETLSDIFRRVRVEMERIETSGAEDKIEIEGEEHEIAIRFDPAAKDPEKFRIEHTFRVGEMIGRDGLFLDFRYQRVSAQAPPGGVRVWSEKSAFNNQKLMRRNGALINTAVWKAGTLGKGGLGFSIRVRFGDVLRLGAIDGTSLEESPEELWQYLSYRFQGATDEATRANLVQEWLPKVTANIGRNAKAVVLSRFDLHESQGIGKDSGASDGWITDLDLGNAGKVTDGERQTALVERYFIFIDLLGYKFARKFFPEDPAKQEAIRKAAHLNFWNALFKGTRGSAEGAYQKVSDPGMDYAEAVRQVSQDAVQFLFPSLRTRVPRAELRAAQKGRPIFDPVTEDLAGRGKYLSPKERRAAIAGFFEDFFRAVDSFRELKPSVWMNALRRTELIGQDGNVDKLVEILGHAGFFRSEAFRQLVRSRVQEFLLDGSGTKSLTKGNYRTAAELTRKTAEKLFEQYLSSSVRVPGLSLGHFRTFFLRLHQKYLSTLLFYVLSKQMSKGIVVAVFAVIAEMFLVSGFPGQILVFVFGAFVSCFVVRPPMSRLVAVDKNWVRHALGETLTNRIQGITDENIMTAEASFEANFEAIRKKFPSREDQTLFFETQKILRKALGVNLKYQWASADGRWLAEADLGKRDADSVAVLMLREVASKNHGYLERLEQAWKKDAAGLRWTLRRALAERFLRLVPLARLPVTEAIAEGVALEAVSGRRRASRADLDRLAEQARKSFTKQPARYAEALKKRILELPRDQQSIELTHYYAYLRVRLKRIAEDIRTKRTPRLSYFQIQLGKANAWLKILQTGVFDENLSDHGYDPARMTEELASAIEEVASSIRAELREQEGEEAGPIQFPEIAKPLIIDATHIHIKVLAMISLILMLGMLDPRNSYRLQDWMSYLNLYRLQIAAGLTPDIPIDKVVIGTAVILSPFLLAAGALLFRRVRRTLPQKEAGVRTAPPEGRAEARKVDERILKEAVERLASLDLGQHDASRTSAHTIYHQYIDQQSQRGRSVTEASNAILRALLEKAETEKDRASLTAAYWLLLMLGSATGAVVENFSDAAMGDRYKILENLQQMHDFFRWGERLARRIDPRIETNLRNSADFLASLSKTGLKSKLQYQAGNEFKRGDRFFLPKDLGLYPHMTWALPEADTGATVYIQIAWDPARKGLIVRKMIEKPQAGEGPVEEVVLPVGQALEIGRGRGQGIGNIPEAFRQVSREHLKIHFDEAGNALVDFRGQNSSRVIIRSDLVSRAEARMAEEGTAVVEKTPGAETAPEWAQEFIEEQQFTLTSGADEDRGDFTFRWRQAGPQGSWISVWAEDEIGATVGWFHFKLGANGVAEAENSHDKAESDMLEKAGEEAIPNADFAVFVEPSATGRGIGDALLQLGGRLARHQFGVREILFKNVTSGRAKVLYERNQATKVPKKNEYVFPTGTLKETVPAIAEPKPQASRRRAESRTLSRAEARTVFSPEISALLEQEGIVTQDARGRMKSRIKIGARIPVSQFKSENALGIGLSGEIYSDSSEPGVFYKVVRKADLSMPPEEQAKLTLERAIDLISEAQNLNAVRTQSLQPRYERTLHDLLAAKLRSGTAELLEIGETDDGRFYLKLRGIPGGHSLDSAEGQQLNFGQRILILQEAALILAAVHEQTYGQSTTEGDLLRWIHGDIKPGNILFRLGTNARGELEYQVMIIDFGSVTGYSARGYRLEGLRPRSRSESYTSEQDYEVHQGTGQMEKYSYRTDVFMFARTLIEVLLNLSPFESKELQKAFEDPGLMRRYQSAAVARLEKSKDRETWLDRFFVSIRSSFPAKKDHWLTRIFDLTNGMTQADPADRNVPGPYSNMMLNVAAALEDIYKEWIASAERSSQLYRSPRTPTRRPRAELRQIVMFDVGKGEEGFEQAMEGLRHYAGESRVPGLSVNPDGRQVIFEKGNWGAVALDGRNGELTIRFKNNTGTKTSVLRDQAVSFLPKGDVVLSTGDLADKNPPMNQVIAAMQPQPERFSDYWDANFTVQGIGFNPQTGRFVLRLPESGVRAFQQRGTAADGENLLQFKFNPAGFLEFQASAEEGPGRGLPRAELRIAAEQPVDLNARHVVALDFSIAPAEVNASYIENVFDVFQERMAGIFGEKRPIAGTQLIIGSHGIRLENASSKEEELNFGPAVLNAIEALAEEARRTGSPVQGKIAFRFYRQGDFLVVEIQDNGPGMSREVLGRLNPANVYTTKPDPELEILTGGYGVGIGRYEGLVAPLKGELIIKTQERRTGKIFMKRIDFRQQDKDPWGVPISEVLGEEAEGTIVQWILPYAEVATENAADGSQKRAVPMPVAKASTAMTPSKSRAELRDVKLGFDAGLLQKAETRPGMGAPVIAGIIAGGGILLLAPMGIVGISANRLAGEADLDATASLLRPAEDTSLTALSQFADNGQAITLFGLLDRAPSAEEITRIRTLAGLHPNQVFRHVVFSREVAESALNADVMGALAGAKELAGSKRYGIRVVRLDSRSTGKLQAELASLKRLTGSDAADATMFAAMVMPSDILEAVSASGALDPEILPMAVLTHRGSLSPEENLAADLLAGDFSNKVFLGLLEQLGEGFVRAGAGYGITDEAIAQIAAEIVAAMRAAAQAAQAA